MSVLPDESEQQCRIQREAQQTTPYGYKEQKPTDTSLRYGTRRMHKARDAIAKYGNENVEEEGAGMAEGESVENNKTAVCGTQE